MPNTFMCSIAEKLAHENKLPNLLRRYVDDTFDLLPDLTTATYFLPALNNAYSAIQFTMETAYPSLNNSLPLAGMVITKTDNHIKTSVYRKKRPAKSFLSTIRAMWTGNRYNRSLIRTMLDRAKRLSSSQDFQRMPWSKKIVSETEIPYKSYWSYFWEISRLPRLIYEMLFIRKRGPTLSLNTQNDFIPAKLFTKNFLFLCLSPPHLFWNTFPLSILYIICI